MGQIYYMLSSRSIAVNPSGAVAILTDDNNVVYDRSGSQVINRPRYLFSTTTWQLVLPINI